MAQLAFQAARAHLLARVRVERRGVQCVGHALDDRRAQLVAVGVQQPARGPHELLDGAGLVALLLRAKRLDERCALGDELVEGKAVEVVRLHPLSLTCPPRRP